MKALFEKYFENESSFRNPFWKWKHVLFEQEPEVYELEIMQPPTRDDWITDIREAVDAASPGMINYWFLTTETNFEALYIFYSEPHQQSYL